MNKTTFVITICLLSMVLLVPLTAGSQGGPFKAILDAIAGLQTQIAGIEGPRAFYLTTTTHNGAQALTACAAGFHMASLWEILDVSNLRYNTTLGVTADDSGSGPPTDLGGWGRTGYAAETGGLGAGFDNCNAWSSANPMHSGTLVVLEGQWENLNSPRVSPWIGAVQSCGLPSPVWCVED